MKKILISENTYKKLFLTEGKHNSNYSSAKHYLYTKTIINKVGEGNDAKLVPENRLNDEVSALQFIGLVSSIIPNVRLDQYFFLALVTRMYREGELINAQDLSLLNNLLPIMINHEDDFPKKNYKVPPYNTFPDITLDILKDRYYDEYFTKNQNDKENLGKMGYQSTNEYSVVRVPDFETAKRYYKYFDANEAWCVTYREDMYDKYTNDSLGIFYFLLKNGFKSIEKPSEPNGNPKDEYGMSMIAVSVDEMGNLNTSTSRWNHDNKGNDNLFTTEELSRLIGRNFYDVFRPRYTKEEFHDMIMGDMSEITKLSDTLSYGEYNGKYYLIKDGDLLTDKYGKYILLGSKHTPDGNGYYQIVLGDKWTLIDSNGQKVWGDKCFNWICPQDDNETYRVKSDRGWTLVNSNGENIWGNQWFNWISDLDTCCNYIVELDNGWALLNPQGENICDNTIFDIVNPLDDNDNYRVESDGVWTLVNSQGENILGDKWFDWIDESDSNENYRVQSNKGWTLVNVQGKNICGNTIFDVIYAPDGNDNYIVKFDNKQCALISPDGESIFGNMRFDYIRLYDYSGNYKVVLNDDIFYINYQTLDVADIDGNVIGNLKTPNFNFDQESESANVVHESIRLNRLIKSITRKVIREQLIK